MIKLKESSDIALIESVIKDPEIFARISEDGVSIEDYEIPENVTYLLILKDTEIIGTWCIYPTNKTTLNIHCNILESHRHHGKEAGKLILEWFVDRTSINYQKLNAEIPLIYPEVYHYTKKFGFKDEGINRKSISKQGELVDQWRLGITRDEVLLSKYGGRDEFC